MSRKSNFKEFIDLKIKGRVFKWRRQRFYELLNKKKLETMPRYTDDQFRFRGPKKKDESEGQRIA